VRPYLEKNLITKKSWWSGSKGRPEVQTLVLQKKKKKKPTSIGKLNKTLINNQWVKEIKREIRKQMKRTQHIKNYGIQEQVLVENLQL
jgi:hypothetical protein